MHIPAVPMDYFYEFALCDLKQIYFNSLTDASFRLWLF